MPHRKEQSLEYAGILIFFIVGAGIVIASYIISFIIRPHRPNPEKLATYECGERPIGPAWVQYNAAYYLFALVFVIFDVEIIFLIPWAVLFRQLGIVGFIEMALFIAILLIGLAYAWRKQALKWS